MKSVNIIALITSILMVVMTGTAMADGGLYEATESCAQRAKTQLGLGNLDHIERDYGSIKLSHDRYEIYFNVNLREHADAESASMRVKCTSEGFGKVRQFSTSEGLWAFKTRSDTTEFERRVAANTP